MKKSKSVSTIVIRALFIIILGMCAVPVPGFKTESAVVALFALIVFVLSEVYCTKDESHLQ